MSKLGSRQGVSGLFGAIALAGLLLGCGGGGGNGQAPTGAGDEPLKVVATTGMIADIARQVGGDDATVEALMGPGVDPHLFKASESDVHRLHEADVVLFNGLHLEGKMTYILGKMARTKQVVAVAEALPPDRLLEDADNAGTHDPHVWFDVSLWAQTVPVIVDALAEADPDGAAGYRARGETLQASLSELDGWVEQQVGTIPEGRRVLVTAHDAFRYFGARYGVEVVGLQGLSTVTEAGLSDVSRVVDLVTERKLPAMFVESSVPAKSIEAVQEACADRGHEVALGGELFSDAMGADGTPEGSYDGMVRHNVDTLVGALK